MDALVCAHNCLTGFKELQQLWLSDYNNYQAHIEAHNPIYGHSNQDQIIVLLNQLYQQRANFIHKRDCWLHDNGPCFSGNCAIRHHVNTSQNQNENIHLMLFWYDQTIARITNT